MESGIYAWLCVPTGERYVGYAVLFSNRQNSHLRKLRKGKHKNSKFQEAWNKYGEIQFKFEILEKCQKSKLVEREKWWIDFYQADKVGFNIQPIGSRAYLRHGMTGTRTFKSWESMLQRCTNPNSPDYPKWGGKGVKVHPRWLKFENFYDDMGERPLGTSLDRFPNKSGDYKPKNCRWATAAEQQRNLKSNTYITYKDETKLLIDWAEEKGIPRDLLRKRLNAGMKGDELFAPSYSRFKGILGAVRRKKVETRYDLLRYEYNGKMLTITELAELSGVSRWQVEQRLIKYRMPVEKAISKERLPKTGSKTRRMITAFGKTQTLTKWAEELKMSPSTIKCRIDDGMEPEVALQRGRL